MVFRELQTRHSQQAVCVRFGFDVDWLTSSTLLLQFGFSLPFKNQLSPFLLSFNWNRCNKQSGGCIPGCPSALLSCSFTFLLENMSFPSPKPPPVSYKTNLLQNIFSANSFSTISKKSSKFSIFLFFSFYYFILLILNGSGLTLNMILYQKCLPLLYLVILLFA